MVNKNGEFATPGLVQVKRGRERYSDLQPRKHSQNFHKRAKKMLRGRSPTHDYPEVPN